VKRRRSGSRKPAKARHITKLRQGSAAKGGLRAGLSVADLEDQIERQARELAEARERETATAEVLSVISSSSGDLQPVFEIMLANATRLCQAEYGNLFLRTDNEDEVRYAAMHGLPSSYRDWGSREPLVQMRDHPHAPLTRVAQTKKLLHITDLTKDISYIEHDPRIVALVEAAGAHTIVTVPMLKDDELVGGLALYRREVRAFSPKQIELVQHFAAQAVIAIENARLLNELRQRTTDLTEALEQQTATSEVLQVISSSPGDLEPVFGAMLKNAVRICDAKFGNIYRWDADALHLVASHNTPTAYAEHRRRVPLRIDQMPESLRRMVGTKAPIHVHDIRTSEQRNPVVVAGTELGGIRTVLNVPMLKESSLVGAFIVSRQEVRPFTDKQIELIKNFAAQAVIAIENTRLLNELRQRTDDLTEALEQQKATSDVLEVISGSPSELKPVFQTMLAKATQICDANFGVLNLYENKAFPVVAMHNVPAAFADLRRREPTPLFDPDHPLERVATTKEVQHIADIRAGESYLKGNPSSVAFADLAGARTLLSVPMLKEDELIGVIGIYRQEVRLFTDKQIELVKNFAAQAVIAVENARLLNELRESLKQQTATADVLKVISRSTFDLQTVLDTLVRSAHDLCDADITAMHRREDAKYRIYAIYGGPTPEEHKELILNRIPFEAGRGSLLARTVLERKPVQIADVLADPDYSFQEVQKRMGYRTILGVPTLREGNAVGALVLMRLTVRPFTERQIELAQTFADQAGIAIENARLLSELRELNQNLERRVSDQVGEIERMGRLRRFLPPQVADLIVASGTEKQLESHRREITALFCDLRGFTGFSESADPEDVSALLREYHAAIGEKIIKYSGTLERYAGDGVMVVFNDPVPVENPALQAVLMALEMRDAIGALTETWRRWGHEIGFGIGIAHGFATLGTIGFEGRFDYAAIGTVSNVASRLCDEAKPGQILISPRVLTKVEDAVKVESIGEFELKGIRRPLAAYNVLSAIA
jgi:two-component system, NtrC family, sensor kinase